jgi:hypothetical protein
MKRMERKEEKQTQPERKEWKKPELSVLDKKETLGGPITTTVENTTFKTVS